jgi:tripartite-type tricarboxylate transporter receptor subunit TctC
MVSLQRISSRSFLLIEGLRRFAPNIHQPGRAFTLSVVVWAALTMTTAIAAEYPARPIRYIVPFAPGSTADINARMLATELSKQIGQQILVDNRPGAAGSTGTGMIARAAPDGYTIGFSETGILAIVRSLYANLPYDPDKDFQMVVQVTFQAELLAVMPALPIRSVKELIDYAKNSPGKLSYGSAGNGSVQHLCMELFKLMTGTQIIHVPYQSIQQATTDMIGERVQVMFDTQASILPHVKAGRVRGLAVSSPKRSPVVPELPTIAEAGVPGFEVTVWSGVIVPAGVPKPIVARLNAEINKALATPTLKEKYAAIGSQLVGGTPEHFAEHVKKETAKWADVIKRSGAKVD